VRDDATNASRIGRPGSRPLVRARLSSLSSLASASGHELPVAEGAEAASGPARPVIHVALAEPAFRRRIADNAGRFGWDIVNHDSAAALTAALQQGPAPALVVVEASDAPAVRSACGANLPLLAVRTTDVEILEDENTRVAAVDGLGRALIDAAGRLRARMQPAQRASAPMLRGPQRSVAPLGPQTSREAS